MVGVADVIEMQAVNIVILGDLSHGVDFQFLVSRVRRAEPAVLLGTIEVDLSSVQRFHFGYEGSVGRVTHVEIDFPDVALDAIFFTGFEAEFDLIAFFGNLRCGG